MLAICMATPTFNRGPLLARVGSSLRSQTFADFESILVDDTEQIINGFADLRIQYVYQENGSTNSARITGERCAKGRLTVAQERWRH
jgi:glycosyltransferase involved in cell wall biosynthesis